MKQEQLNAIKERVAQVTSGPWESGQIVGKRSFCVIDKDSFVAKNMTRKDSEFVAHAREDVPALIAEVERLQTELEKTEKCYEIIKKAAFKTTDKMTHFKNALEKVMEVEAPIMEGWETPAYKIAQEALGGEAHE